MRKNSKNYQKKSRFYKEFGELVSKYRKFRGYVQDDTATFLEKTRTSIHLMENGKNATDLYDAFTLIDKLDIPFDKIKNIYEQFKP